MEAFAGIKLNSGQSGGVIPSLAMSKEADEVKKNLKSSISTIERLLEQGSVANLTYAALECRLAIECICYERLRVAHDYISHDDLKKWRPQDIVNVIVEEANSQAATTLTISISPEPLPEGGPPSTLEEYEAMTFLPVGTQIGFDPNKLGKLWQALAHLALHVSLPTNTDDDISRYGDAEKIRAKVEEALEEIRRIAEGSLMFSGLGEEISFVCCCGATNKRRLTLLKAGQTISCVNPECRESYDFMENDLSFRRRTLETICRKCGELHNIPKKLMERLRTDQSVCFNCARCRERISISWRLMQGQKTKVEN